MGCCEHDRVADRAVLVGSKSGSPTLGARSGFKYSKCELDTFAQKTRPKAKDIRLGGGLENNYEQT